MATKCFYSGVTLLSGHPNATFNKTREHLISKKSKLYSWLDVNDRSKNIVYASKTTNGSLANLPVVIKLAIRKQLHNVPETLMNKKIILYTIQEQKKKFNFDLRVDNWNDPKWIMADKIAIENLLGIELDPKFEIHREKELA